MRTWNVLEQTTSNIHEVEKTQTVKYIQLDVNEELRRLECLSYNVNFRKCIFLLSAKFSSYQLAQLCVLLNLGLSLELSVRKSGPEFRFPYKSMFYTCMFYTQLKI